MVGVAGILATATGELIRALGAGRAYALLASIEAGGIALLALAPGSLTAAFASAVMFGATYSAAVGVQAIWSSQLFSARPSLGLSATMAANGTGLMLGPVAAGAAGPATGLLAGGSGRPRERPLPAAPRHTRLTWWGESTPSGQVSPSAVSLASTGERLP